MSTNATTPPTPKTPKNPAKGNQQGQTTLAAKIDRWEGMSNNLLPLLDEVPQLKAAHAQLQQTIADAKALRDRLRLMKSEVQGSTTQRKEMVATGEGLFSHISLGLRFAFGANSDRLAAFAVKPRKTGRPSKLPAPVPAPTTEVSAAPAADPKAAK
jgi:hypothetical protein